MDKAPLPPVLNGFRVIDLSRLLPGDLASLILLDMGAEVIKVEDKGMGDYLRIVPPMIKGQGAFFRFLNRGKRSITLDLKKEEGRALLLRLLKGSHILIETFRPGVVERLGLSYEEVRGLCPGIVYASISGFGRGNSLSSKGAHDLNFLALSGYLYLLSSGSRRPVIPLVQFGDVIGGSMQAALSIVAALLRRERTGEGSFLDISILEGLISSLIMNLSEIFAGKGVIVDHLGGGSPFYNIYETKDGRYLALASLEPPAQIRILKVLGFEEPLPAGEITPLMRERISGKDLSEWEEIFEGQDLCITPVLDLSEMLRRPYTSERGIVFDAGHGEARYPALKTPVPPSLFSPSSLSPSPEQGQDTKWILMREGLSQEEIEELESRGVV